MPGDPELAEVLRANGRATTGPLFEALLAEATRRDEIACPDPAEAFGVLYGLAVRDTQIAALLGAALERTPQRIDARAADAVELFYRLYAVGQTAASSASSGRGRASRSTAASTRRRA